jgi:hypothetical protein
MGKRKDWSALAASLNRRIKFAIRPPIAFVADQLNFVGQRCRG